MPRKYQWGHAIIRRRRWRVRETPSLYLRGNAGECDPPEQANKEIRLASGMQGLELLDTLVHEMMHAAHPDLHERAVLDTCTDIATFIWRHRERLLKEETDA